MNVTTSLDGEKLTVICEGKLGSTSAPELEKAVRNNINGVSELVFDFAKLEYLASAGLRVLMSAGKVMKNKGEMRIINVPPEVMEGFTFTGMADILNIEEL